MYDVRINVVKRLPRRNCMQLDTRFVTRECVKEPQARQFPPYERCINILNQAHNISSNRSTDSFGRHNSPCGYLDLSQHQILDTIAS